MAKILSYFALAAACVVLIGQATAVPASGGAFETGRQRNLFAELLGRTEEELQRKLDAVWLSQFQGDPETQRLYYPVLDGMAYIADTGNRDVRSEGMSYGLMLAVQLDRKAEFDALWKWAKTHMYHADGPRRGYFAWQCGFDGSTIDPGSASDGEEWIAMALFFAAHRWGRGEGIFDYEAEAQALLRAMREGDRGDGITAIFHPRKRMVVFVPNEQASRFTDPSYHLPAFYELWARWSSEKDAVFWSKAAATSREYFRKAAHPRTGLMPEYAHFDGSPLAGEKGDFRYDAWRVIANVALDHAWFGGDPWAVEQSDRILGFLQSQGPGCLDRFTLDGRPVSTDSSIGLFAMAAVGGLASSDPELARTFVLRLWNAPIPEGRWRYYNGLLYHLALLQAGGRFQIIQPKPLTPARP